jgi:phosphoribosyl-ATP pyrophosphohydrolase
MSRGEIEPEIERGAGSFGDPKSPAGMAKPVPAIMQSGAEMLRKRMNKFTLHDLEKRVQDRAQECADVSYTRKLLDRGVVHCAKKLGEEAVEAAIAAVGEDRQRMIAEAADVLYHLLVVLHARGILLDEVEAELGTRTRQSGLDEKAARKSG